MAKNITGSAVLNFLSASDVEIENIQSTRQDIPVGLIVLHPENTAAQHDTDEEIQELAENIRVNGLLHPLVVHRLADGTYRLISGERRYRAITIYLGWKTVPCTVYENLSPSAEKIMLISANTETRKYNKSDMLKLYTEYDAALRELKSEGKYKGGIQKGIAALMGVSDRQIRNYRAELEQETASKTASPKKEKAEIISAFSDDELIELLQCVYNTQKVIEFYQTAVPTTKEAIPFLKPDTGYHGASLLHDGKQGHWTKTNPKLEIRFDGRKQDLKYTEIDRLIRLAIATRKWKVAPQSDAATSNGDEWEQWREQRDYMLDRAVEDLADDRPSDSADKWFTIDDRFFASLEKALDRLIKKSNGRLMDDDDQYDRVAIFAEKIAEDLLTLESEIYINSLAGDEE